MHLIRLRRDKNGSTEIKDSCAIEDALVILHFMFDSIKLSNIYAEYIYILLYRNALTLDPIHSCG